MDNKVLIREGEKRCGISNSGLQVWLYDEENMGPIRESGGMDFRSEQGRYDEIAKRGLVVGYELYQDDVLDVLVVTGEALTEGELSFGRWLEPQKAFLSLPSGTLCVEPNDASRIGPETPTEEGATVKIEPGGLSRYALPC